MAVVWAPRRRVEAAFVDVLREDSGGPNRFEDVSRETCPVRGRIVFRTPFHVKQVEVGDRLFQRVEDQPA